MFLMAPLNSLISSSRFYVHSCCHKWQNFLLLLYLKNIPVCVCDIFCILHLPVGHLGGFHVLAIVNNNAVNMVGSWTYLLDTVIWFPLDKYSKVELLNMVVPVFMFWETFMLFSIMATPVYISTSSTWQFPFLHVLTNIFGIAVDRLKDL